MVFKLCARDFYMPHSITSKDDRQFCALDWQALERETPFAAALVILFVFFIITTHHRSGGIAFSSHKHTPFHYSNFTLNTEKSYFIGVFRLSCRQYCSASLFNIHRLYSNLIYFPPDASTRERRERLRAGWYSNGSFSRTIYNGSEETHTQRWDGEWGEKRAERDWEELYI